MRESPEAESQQSLCHQQIVKLKVSQDLAQLNWSADHLETNTSGVWIQPRPSTQEPTTPKPVTSSPLQDELSQRAEFPLNPLHISWVLQVLALLHPFFFGSAHVLFTSVLQAALGFPSQSSFIDVKRCAKSQVFL